jgi:hypothetical protein
LLNPDTKHDFPFAETQNSEGRTAGGYSEEQVFQGVFCFHLKKTALK